MRMARMTGRKSEFIFRCGLMERRVIIGAKPSSDKRRRYIL
jgi:hypothetical protein